VLLSLASIRFVSVFASALSSYQTPEDLYSPGGAAIRETVIESTWQGESGNTRGCTYGGAGFLVGPKEVS